jgi:hypothetical protein
LHAALKQNGHTQKFEKDVKDVEKAEKTEVASEPA